MGLTEGKHCAACRVPLADGSIFYTLRLELFAAPEAGETKDGDFGAEGTDELAWLLARLQHLNDVELREEERRVFERFSFSLCPAAEEPSTSDSDISPTDWARTNPWPRSNCIESVISLGLRPGLRLHRS